MITIFDPLMTKKFSLPARIVRSATAERIAMQNTRDGDLLGTQYAALARGGAGLIISGHIAVHPTGRLHPLMAAIYTAENLAAWRRAVNLTHAAGGRLFLQLNHGGGRCPPGTAVAPVCVSPLPDRPRDPLNGIQLTSGKIQELIRAFAESAKRARELGADGVQLHGAHGYLASQFLSPLTNRRPDKWGGALEGRSRFLRLMVPAVRAAVGADFPLGIKLGANDDDAAGLTIAESLQVARWLEDELDFIEISGGFRADIVRRRVSPGVNEGYFLPFAVRFKKKLKIPVFSVGGWRSLAKMNEALSAGQCDAVAASRPFIRQPDFPLILRAGGESACRGCDLCLFKNDQPTACHAGKNKPRK